MEKEYDIIGIGNSLLDIIVEVEETALLAHGLTKGEMHLIDSARSKSILDGLKDHTKTYISGGSAANTISGASLLGAKGFFVGIVGDDVHGKKYEDDMRHSGVVTNLARHQDIETGCAITFITPDGERTFATYLGAAKHLGKHHISEEEIQKSKILHVEGYLLSDISAREAVVSAMDFALKHGVLVSVDLSAPWVIENNLAVIKDIVKKYVNIVFVNEDEAVAFTGKKEREALQAICDLCDIAVVKLGARGSLVQAEGKIYTIDPQVIEVMNTNGAGDMYAAGFLHGISQGRDIESAGKLGSHVASLVIASPGARMHETHFHKLKDILVMYQ
ncbi:MAG: adenosine kinase [Candidatus Moraniibacteriota bacterium]